MPNNVTITDRLKPSIHGDVSSSDIYKKTIIYFIQSTLESTYYEYEAESFYLRIRKLIEASEHNLSDIYANTEDKVLLNIIKEYVDVCEDNNNLNISATLMNQLTLLSYTNRALKRGWSINTKIAKDKIAKDDINNWSKFAINSALQTGVNSSIEEHKYLNQPSALMIALFNANKINISEMVTDKTYITTKKFINHMYDTISTVRSAIDLETYTKKVSNILSKELDSTIEIANCIKSNMINKDRKYDSRLCVPSCYITPLLPEYHNYMLVDTYPLMNALYGRGKKLNTNIISHNDIKYKSELSPYTNVYNKPSEWVSDLAKTGVKSSSTLEYDLVTELSIPLKYNLFSIDPIRKSHHCITEYKTAYSYNSKIITMDKDKKEFRIKCMLTSRRISNILYIVNNITHLLDIMYNCDIPDTGINCIKYVDNVILSLFNSSHYVGRLHSTNSVKLVNVAISAILHNIKMLMLAASAPFLNVKNVKDTIDNNITYLDVSMLTLSDIYYNIKKEENE